MSLRSPFTAQPAVEELKTSFRLVKRNHMSTTIQTHKGKVAMRLDLTNILALVLVIHDRQVLQFRFSKRLATAPLKSFGPRLVAEPVADEVGVAGVDEDVDLIDQGGHDTVEGFHPVTMEQEVAVDVHVAGVVAADFNAEGVHDGLLVEPLGDPAELGVAEGTAVFALGADVIDVLAGALVGADHGVVAVDGCWDADPGAFAAVARFDHGQAARKCVIH